MKERATGIGHVLHRPWAYDVVAWVHTLGRERRFRDRLIDLARLDVGESVLDVGCGTGSLAIAAKARVGSTGEVCGVDPSSEMIGHARRKAARAGVGVRFETATMQALPFPDATFDAVLSTLMLHHLPDEGRQQGIDEVARVLKPGGRFLAVDIGGGGSRGHRHFFGRRKHTDFDIGHLTPALDRVGLHIIEEGPVPSVGVIGLSGLRFILAGAPAPLG
jgi:ubiquinone/menaquinone biosynthesis C-methylase UbiE